MKRSRLAVHFAVGVAAALALACGVARGQTRIDTDLAGAGINSSCLPKTALDSGGNLHAVWQDYRNSEWAIYYRKATGFGSTWTGTEMRLSATGSHALDPRIACDGTNLIIAWRTVTSTTVAVADERAYARIYNGTSGIWTASQQLNTGGVTDYVSPPDVAANTSGNLYVVWAQAAGAVDHVFFRSYSLNTAPTGWMTSPTQLSAAATTARANWPRVAAGGVQGTTRRVYVAYIRTTTTPSNEVDFTGSLDNGATFPSNRSAVVNSGLANSTAVDLTLAANTGGVIHVVWTDSTASPGHFCLEGMRNTSFGLNTAWSSAPTRVDTATVPTRVLAYTPSVVVDPGGNAYAAFVGTIQDPTSKLLLGNVFEVSALAPPVTVWGTETQVSTATQYLPVQPLMRPRIGWATNGGSTNGMAVVWSQLDSGNDNYAKMWIATVKTGVMWSASKLVGTSASTDPKQDDPDLFVRWVSGSTFQAGVTWDDRVNWSLPFTGGANGYGAPESYFLQFGF